MEFNTGYRSFQDINGTMDRGFYDVNDPDSTGALNYEGGMQGVGTDPTIPYSESNPLTSKGEMGLSIKDIGMSVPMGISAPNVQGIYSKIRSGVSKIEIGFPGMISGNRQAQTPEMYGKDQRQAMRELAKINDVEYTTHAAYNSMGMTGAIEQQGTGLIKFDMDRAKMSSVEVERAIDFASDVAGGGSVTIHAGEFERPLTDLYVPGMDQNLSEADDGRIMFKKRLTEDKDAKLYLVDDRTGQAMSQVEKDRLVAYPEWLKSDKGYWGTDVNENRTYIEKGDYVNYQGRKILNPFDPTEGRVPIYDRESGRFKVRYMSYDDFKHEADEKNFWYEKINGKAPTSYKKVSQTEAYLQATLETQEGHSRGWALQYGERVDGHIETIEKLNKAKEFYQKLDATLPEDEKWKIMMKRYPSTTRITEPMIPGEDVSPVAFIDEQIREQGKSLEFARQASASQEQQAYDTAETKRHVVEPVKYVERFAIRHYSEAGIHAMERSHDPNNPVVVTVEHIFPERFGGHPQELKWLILKARDQMVDYLTEPEIELGMSGKDHPTFRKNEDGTLKLLKQPNTFYRPGLSKEEAQKLADTHLKVTLDTGHLNLWRKYFQPAMNSTPEKNEEEFKRWYLGQFEDLAASGVVGNMHLADNFGYQDDHLSPGQGNSPIKETVAIMKKFGYDKAWTVEPGADASTDLSDFHGLMKTWRFFGSNIYGIGGSAAGSQGGSWGQVQYSYFGQNQPPYFIHGSYAPSNDWTLWSQVPME